MDKDKREEKNSSPLDKEGQDMTTTILKENKINLLKTKLDTITKKSTLLHGDDNMIELSPDNQKHKEWFEKDKYKGK